MTEQMLPISGAIVLHSMQDAPQEEVARVFRGLGYSNFIPETIEPKLALSRALRQCVAAKLFRIENRKKPKKNGVEVMSVVQGEDGNDYPILFNAKVDENNRVASPTMTEDMLEKTQVEFDKQLNYCTGAAIMKSMAKVYAYHGGRTDLKDNGGVYWVPDGAQSLIKEFRTKLQAINPKNSISLFTTAKDGDTMSAVLESVTEEVTNKCAQLMLDFSNLKLRSDGREARRDIAVGLLRTIDKYEKITETTLESLRNQAKLAMKVACTDTLATLDI